jgi:uncharacterized protein YqgC (DUF456 family)
MPADIWILILVLFLCLLGTILCLLPAIPGTLLNYSALWIMQYKYHSFEDSFLIAWSVIIVLSIIADYFMPVWFAKKYGYTKYRVQFSITGIVLGLLCFPFLGIFFTPLSIVVGMLIGAIVGEIVGGKEKAENRNTLVAGLAGFTGAMLSVILKMAVSIVLSIYLFVELTRVS